MNGGVWAYERHPLDLEIAVHLRMPPARHPRCVRGTSGFCSRKFDLRERELWLADANCLSLRKSTHRA